MSETALLLIIGTVCLVFIGAFVATLFNPSYPGFAIAAPAFTACIGLIGGIGLSRRRNGNGNGKATR